MLDSILSLEPQRIMTRRLLIYICLHRSDPSSGGSKGKNAQNRKIDPSLQEDFSVYRRLMSLLPLEWAFVDNFVRQILYNRAVVSNYFLSLSENRPIRPARIAAKKPLCQSRTIHSPHTKENRKQMNSNSNIVPCPDHSTTPEKSTRVTNQGSRGVGKTSYMPGNSNSHGDRNSGGRSHTSGGDGVDAPKKPLAAQSLLSLMAQHQPTVSSSALQQQHQQYQAQQHQQHQAQQQWQPSASIAISPLRTDHSILLCPSPLPFPSYSHSPLPPLSDGDTDTDTDTDTDRDRDAPPPMANCESPKRSSRIIPASLCSPSATEHLAGNHPDQQSTPNSVANSILRGSTSSYQHPGTVSPSTPLYTSPRPALPRPLCPVKPHQAGKPHLQIEITCAQHLPRTPAARRSRNLAARKPGLKVTVRLPAGGAGEEHEGELALGAMKVVREEGGGGALTDTHTYIVKFHLE